MVADDRATCRSRRLGRAPGSCHRSSRGRISRLAKFRPRESRRHLQGIRGRNESARKRTEALPEDQHRLFARRRKPKGPPRLLLPRCKTRPHRKTQPHHHRRPHQRPRPHDRLLLGQSSVQNVVADLWIGAFFAASALSYQPYTLLLMRTSTAFWHRGFVTPQQLHSRSWVFVG